MGGTFALANALWRIVWPTAIESRHESGIAYTSKWMRNELEDVVRAREMYERKARASPERNDGLRVRLLEMRFGINVSRVGRGLPLLKSRTVGGKGGVGEERVGGAREVAGQKEVLAHVERARELRWWLEGMCGLEKGGGLKRKRCDSLGGGEEEDGGRDAKRLHIDPSSSTMLHANMPREVKALKRSSTPGDRQIPRPSQNSAPVRIPGLTLLYSE